MHQFAQIGACRAAQFDGKRVRLEPVHGQHHDHLIDTDTGRVIEFTSPRSNGCRSRSRASSATS